MTEAHSCNIIYYKYSFVPTSIRAVNAAEKQKQSVQVVFDAFDACAPVALTRRTLC